MPRIRMVFFYYAFLTVLIILTLPLQICVALLVLLTSGRPILFVQKRIGKNGKAFLLYKYRTMKRDAQLTQAALSRKNESDGPVFKIYNDPRFTPVGNFLSHTGLDELPQFVNVLRGEMSLIGPRPLPVAEAKKLAPWMHTRERVLPGIISPAILTGSYHKDFRAWMRYDVEYVKQKNPQGDLLLCFAALPFMGRMFVQSVLGTGKA